MAKVFHYVPEVSSKFLCSKGGLHAEEALNLVCLDPLCRNDPLGCSVCFVNVHKHHKVVSLDKFIDDYGRNVKVFKENKTVKKIEKDHLKVQDLISKLRADINRELNSFEQSIQQYAEELRTKTTLRQHISASLGIPLEPAKIKESRNSEQFRESLRFILNNSLFDHNNNMIGVSDILRKDEDRIYALLDKMVNMTQYCQQYIKDVVQTLSFSDNTIKAEKIGFKEQLSKMQLPQDQFDTDNFKEKLEHHKRIAQQIQLRKPNWRSTMYPSSNYSNQQVSQQKVRLTFSMKNKHEMIEIKDRFQRGVSNVTALKPQFALLTPHLTTNPNQVQQWTFKINSCRNFASENTLGIGIGLLNDISDSHFEGHHPKNVTILTSQGYVSQNGRSRKTNLIFGAGDLLYCRYDPFYKLFQITKENGRKISLTVDRPENQELFACVRLTYASDQVQIL